MVEKLLRLRPECVSCVMPETASRVGELVAPEINAHDAGQASQRRQRGQFVLVNLQRRQAVEIS